MLARWFALWGTLVCLAPVVAQAPCGADACHDKAMASNTVYAMGAVNMFEAWTQHPANSAPNEAVIPVVFHVIHKGSSYGEFENISDAQIQSAIVALNEDFRKIPGSNGDGNGVDTGMSFALARRDPAGLPTNGIVRVDGSSLPDYAEDGIAFAGFGGGCPEEQVKDLSFWPAESYVNVWVVPEIEGNNGGGGVQAYSYIGPTGDGLDGVVIMYNLVGTEGSLKATDGFNRTMTHEFGHHFNLWHTFRNTYSCSGTSDCNSQGDQVCDTPRTFENGNCNFPTCPDAQVENYMDYSSNACKNMFTQGQADRMWTCLENLRPGLLNSLGATPVVQADLTLELSILDQAAGSCGNGHTPRIRVINQGDVVAEGWSVSCWQDGELVTAIEGRPLATFGQSQWVEFPLIPWNLGSHEMTFQIQWDPDEWVENNIGLQTVTHDQSTNWIFTMNTDFFAPETSWSLKDSTGLEVMAGFGASSGFQEFVYDLCLSPGCYTLEVLDSGGDGLQWGGGFTLTDDLGNELVSVFDTNDQNIGFGQSYEVCTGLVPVPDHEPSALGCTYPFATNYNPTATVDNGSCYIGGCMDSTATNFQPLASAPLVPCEFAPDPSCFGDADGDGLVGLSDLLTFLSAMGQTCN